MTRSCAKAPIDLSPARRLGRAFLPQQPAPRERQQLLEQFNNIRSYPERFSDYQETGTDPYTVEVHVFRRYAIKYWIDVNDKHVKILDIHLADGPHQ